MVQQVGLRCRRRFRILLATDLSSFSGTTHAEGSADVGVAEVTKSYPRLQAEGFDRLSNRIRLISADLPRGGGLQAPVRRAYARPVHFGLKTEATSETDSSAFNFTTLPSLRDFGDLLFASRRAVSPSPMGTLTGISMTSLGKTSSRDCYRAGGEGGRFSGESVVVLLCPH